jgi:hypothetical protein
VDRHVRSLKIFLREGKIMDTHLCRSLMSPLMMVKRGFRHEHDYFEYNLV